eukprot:TRINITY_DN1152_c0_g1_i1.p1 TRINITY_DN1152_c0_g1~~TRINITY_DN1152_c0_g1_i1.p1  ORF type:complete len:56 (-),score=2.39 TRINITY_DN1152_c0_g1_i1:97-264(-)
MLLFSTILKSRGHKIWCTLSLLRTPFVVQFKYFVIFNVRKCFKNTSVGQAKFFTL